MKINHDQLTERLHVQEKDISELRSTIKKLSADNESLESQVRVYKMYKSKVTDLAEKIDADDIIPKDLESCHREIVSLRASRQLLQSIRKSLEDQNLTLKNKVEELESKNNVSNDKSNEEIVSKTESERKKRTSILGYFSLSPPTEKSSSLQSQVDSPSNTQSVSEKKDEINSIVPIPQPPLEVKKDSDSSPGQKPQPPIEGQPSSVQPMLIKPKEDAPRSPSTFNIAEFFSNL
jgi:chromosome segregation ATPase